MAKAKRRYGSQRLNKPAPSGSRGDLMGRLQKMQEEMAKAQEELANTTLEVTAGGGAITITVDGQQKLRDIQIDPDVVDPEDVEMLQDLILAAVNEALERSQELASERVSGLTGGLSLPGLM